MNGRDPTLGHALARLTGRVPGISAAVVGRRGIEQISSAGVADLADNRPATPDTVYLWFSMTKIVTATAVLQLADRGALSLGDRVERFSPSSQS